MENEYPILYAKGSKKSDVLQWRGWSAGPVVFFEYGKLGGKLQRSHYTALPTNVGRSNYRDPAAQAQFEVKSAWDAKLKEGYYPDVEEAKSAELLLPMLAHRYDKQAAKIKWPRVDAQYKFNGLRCLAICTSPGEVRLISRGNETWNLPHINAACAAVMGPGDILDGEVYRHGVSLQSINSLVKRYRPESLALQYHLYDMPRKAGQIDEWQIRRDNLRELFEDKVGVANASLLTGHVGTTLCLAKTVPVDSPEAATAFEREAILGGYEGVILRNWGGEYRFNYRAYDVQKWKRFQDAEFTVIDMTSRTYVNPSTQQPTLICDVCVCRNNSNEKTFEVVPRGSVEVKAEYWKNKAQYISTPLVVRFLERSDDGIPQGNPVGICFRIDEDINPLEDDEDF